MKKPPVPEKVVFKKDPPPKIKVRFRYVYRSDDDCFLHITSPKTHQILELNSRAVARLRSYPWGKLLLQEILAAIKMRQEAGYLESSQNTWQPTNVAEILVEPYVLTVMHNLLRKK